MKLDVSARDYMIRELIRVLESTQQIYFKLNKLNDLDLIQMYKKLVTEDEQSVFLENFVLEKTKTDTYILLK